MTANSGRKKLVRERMTRTGESFVTANRHVTAARAAAVPDPGAVPGTVPGYPAPRPAAHRASGLVRALLGASGVELSEAAACGLGGGIGFLYAVFEYRGMPHPLLTVVAQHHPAPWIEVTATHLGIGLAEAHSSAVRPALAKLDAVLDSGRPAMIAVARGLLPAHPGVDPLEAAEPHEVVVAGRRDGGYLVEDRPGRIDEIDVDVLGRAWAGHRKGRFLVRSVVAVPDAPDLPAATRAALRLTADHLTGPVLGNSFDVNMGFSGMAKLAAELRDMRTRAGWIRRFPDEAAVRYALDRLRDCLTTTYTAPSGTRGLYAEFLGWAGELLDVPGLTVAAAHMRRAAEHWSAVAATTVGSDDPAVLFAGIADLVDAARAEEERAEAQFRAGLL